MSFHIIVLKPFSFFCVLSSCNNIFPPACSIVGIFIFNFHYTLSFTLLSVSSVIQCFIFLYFCFDISSFPSIYVTYMCLPAAQYNPSSFLKKYTALSLCLFSSLIHQVIQVLVTYITLSAFLSVCLPAFVQSSSLKNSVIIDGEFSLVPVYFFLPVSLDLSTNLFICQQITGKISSIPRATPDLKRCSNLLLSFAVGINFS